MKVRAAALTALIFLAACGTKSPTAPQTQPPPPPRYDGGGFLGGGS